MSAGILPQYDMEDDWQARLEQFSTARPLQEIIGAEHTDIILNELYDGGLTVAELPKRLRQIVRAKWEESEQDGSHEAI